MNEAVLIPIELIHPNPYQDEVTGPVCVAEFLSGLATTWGVDLPADWLEKAASYWPEDVPIQVVTNKKELA